MANTILIINLFRGYVHKYNNQKICLRVLVGRDLEVSCFQ